MNPLPISSPSWPQSIPSTPGQPYAGDTPSSAWSPLGPPPSQRAPAAICAPAADLVPTQPPARAEPALAPPQPAVRPALYMGNLPPRPLLGLPRWLMVASSVQNGAALGAAIAYVVSLPIGICATTMGALNGLRRHIELTEAERAFNDAYAEAAAEQQARLG